MHCVEIYCYSFLSFLHIHKYCVNCEKSMFGVGNVCIVQNVGGGCVGWGGYTELARTSLKCDS